jgi:signal transduction histidine kinase
LIQHVMLAIAVGVLAYTVTGSNVIISGVNGDFSYELHEADKGREYEDSYLFNNILGNGISNVVRLTAIRSQIETNGSYDGTKKIDVTAYVNRGTMLPGDYITAIYTVSDLLKWAQSGFEYQEKNFTNAQTFLSTATTYTHLLNNTFSGGMNSYLNSQLDDNMSSRTVSGNGTDLSAGGGKHTVLIDRYKTVDGKDVEDLVSSWQEYQELCRNVEEAASDLNQNYSEYLDFTKYYDYQNTNLRYYITRTIGAKTEVYTNVSQLMGETTGIDIKSEFEKYGKYIYYCPYELAYDTNTMLDEETLRKILKDYEYAYPDQIRIYVGVDTQNYPCKDDFTQGKTVFGKYVPYSNQMMIAGISAACIYLILLLYLIAREGHVVPAQIIPVKKQSAFKTGENNSSPAIMEINGIYMEYADRIYTELLMLFCILIIGVFIILAYYVSEIFDGFTQQTLYPVFIAGVAFLCDIVFSVGFYSLVRRGKAGTLWSNSFLQHIIIGGRKMLLRSMDNGNVIIRTWIPYVLFMIVNGLLFMVGVPGMILAILMDIYIGFTLYRSNLDRQDIVKGIRRIRDGNVNYKVDTSHLHGDNIILAEAVNSIGDGIEKAVSISMKDEKMKADLITNVSHDIKTPLTSIINYVDLIKREDIQDPKIRGYVEVLDEKSQRLKQLTVDLVEASKISSGNISLTLEKINFVELINQTIGEFYEKFEQKGLRPVFKPQENEIYIMADSRHLWRVIENLLNNVFKYALENTRVYMDLDLKEENGTEKVVFSIKNISANELNINADELTERFIRGDVSRSTEGSGLGLSIAKSLTLAQNGTFNIVLDGDLFKAVLEFDREKKD